MSAFFSAREPMCCNKIIHCVGHSEKGTRTKWEHWSMSVTPVKCCSIRTQESRCFVISEIILLLTSQSEIHSVVIKLEVCVI
jgi:hypothetical protein